MKPFIAWAIDTQSTEGHGLLGRYFFDSLIPRHPSLEGCVTALFKSRAIARQYCGRVSKSDTWTPKVIQVKVTIEEIENG